MSITSLTSSTTPASATAGATTASSTDASAMQDRFLKLLVAQINSQDPLSPMDNAQMTSQMAQINTVNGIQQLNQTLTGMASQFTALQVLQGASMVGHNVLVPGTSLVPDPSTGVATSAVDLAGNADNVKVEILAPGGQVLDTINSGPLPQGRHTFQWNTANYQGSGTPSYRATATLGTQAVATTSLMSQQVMSVGTTNGAMSIELQSGKSVAYTDIAAIL